MVVSDFLDIFLHTLFKSPYLFVFVFDSSTILKHTMFYWYIISFLYAILFRSFIIYVSPLYFVSSTSFSGVFTLPIIRILHLLISYIAIHFPDHIHHLFFTHKGYNTYDIFVHIFILFFRFTKYISLHIELQSKLEGPNNLGSCASMYSIGFCSVYFNIKYRIMIGFIILVNPFVVCIAIKIIHNFFIWESLSLLLKTPSFHII